MEPKIRLNGFEGEWVKAPFSEIANRTSASASSLNYPGVEFEDINSGEGTLNKDVSRKKIVKIGKLFSEGDVLFGKLRPYLKNILLADFKGVAIGDFWVLRPQKVTSELLYILLNSREFMRIANISSGSKMPRADWNLVSSTPFAYPETKEEQDAIGAYFQYLESMIQSTTKKIESLKQVKVASLQAMFPQEGETTPRIRFKGFEGEWNCIEFGSIITECLDKTTIEDEDILLSSAIDGVYLNSELFGHFRGKSNIGYRKLKKNMLILSAQNLHLGNANVNLRFEHGIVSPAYKIYYIHDCNPELLSHWIKREETKKFFLDATTAGASACRKNIVWEDLYKQTLYLPKDELEQQKLASYLTSLTNQITLQTKRLEKLKQIKSACLDNMFV